jgi:hypothetical protein
VSHSDHIDAVAAGEIGQAMVLALLDGAQPPARSPAVDLGEQVSRPSREPLRPAEPADAADQSRQQFVT